MQEISDLKNIVIQSLESNGMLSQLRAQIRASVFKIIEDQESKETKSPALHWENPLAQKIHEAQEGELALSIMTEFLEFFRLDYSHNVFIHESNLSDQNKSSRQELMKKFGFSEGEQAQQQKPILFLMLNQLLKGGMSQVEQPAQNTQQSQGGAPEQLKVDNKLGDLNQDARLIQEQPKPAQVPAQQAPAEVQPQKEHHLPEQYGQKQQQEDQLKTDQNLEKLKTNQSDESANNNKAMKLELKSQREQRELKQNSPAKPTETAIEDEKVQINPINLDDDEDLIGISEPKAAVQKPKKENKSEDEIEDDFGDDFEHDHIEDQVTESQEMDSQGHAQADLEDDDINDLMNSDEMYISESLGVNYSVSSTAIDNFDYKEDVEPVQ